MREFGPVNLRGHGVVRRFGLALVLMATAATGLVAVAVATAPPASAAVPVGGVRLSSGQCSALGGTMQAGGTLPGACALPVPDANGDRGRCTVRLSGTEGVVLTSGSETVVWYCQHDPAVSVAISSGSPTVKCRKADGSVISVTGTTASGSNKGSGKSTGWFSLTAANTASCGAGWTFGGFSMSGGGSASIVGVSAYANGAPTPVGTLAPYDYYGNGSPGDYVYDSTSSMSCLVGQIDLLPHAAGVYYPVDCKGAGAKIGSVQYVASKNRGSCCTTDKGIYLYAHNTSSSTATNLVPAGTTLCFAFNQPDGRPDTWAALTPTSSFAGNVWAGAITGLYGSASSTFRGYQVKTYDNRTGECPYNLDMGPAPAPALADGPVSAPEVYGSHGCSVPQVRQPHATKKPVNTATGNFWHTFHDIDVPGRGRALSLSRTYNSLDTSNSGWFGPGWTSSYDTSLTATSSTAVVKQSNGSRVTFTLSNGTYSAPARANASLVQNQDGSWTFTCRKQQIDTFDSSGRMIAQHDLNGNTTTITYPNANTVVVTDPGNRSLTFSFSNGVVTSVQDSASTPRSASYSYDAAGNLSDVIDIGGGHSQFTYDTSHRMLTMRSARFYGDTTTSPTPVTTNHYDSESRIDWQSDELGRTTSFDYTTVPGSTIVTDPKGNKVRYGFDYGILTSETRGYGSSTPSTWTYSYDPTTGATTSVVAPNGATWTYTNDADSNVLSATDPFGNITSATYNSLDEPLTQTDAKNVTTTYTYDTAGNLLTKSTPWLEGPAGSNQLVTYHHDSTTHPEDVTSITDPRGKTSSLTYDTAGNLTSAVDPLSHTTLNCFDEIGRRTAAITPKGSAAGSTCASLSPAAGTSYFSNDAFGRVLSVADPLGHTTSRVFDADGNMVSSTDGLNHTTTYAYDAAGEPTTTTRADSTSTTTDYWPDGSIYHQYDATGHGTTYAYDAQGRLSTVTDANGNVTTYGYDSSGNRVAKQNPGGNCAASPATGCTTYAYTALNQLSGVTYTDGTTNITNITYDADGQRTGMTDAAGGWSFTYDSLHRLTQSQLTNVSRTTYGYDLNGDLTSIGYPSMSYPNIVGTVTRAFDDAGRLTGVTDWLNHTTTFSYDADGNLTGQINPNGTSSSYTFDGGDSLSGISHAPTASPNTPFAAFSYTRDTAAQLTGVTTTGSSALNGDSHTWAYTSLNQLASDTTSPSSYQYDTADNLARLGDGTIQAYDNANQLCWSEPAGSTGTCSTPPTGATTYVYDARGNRTSMTAGAATTSYAYTSDNLLKSYTSAGATTTYKYNADGLRTKRSGSDTSTYTWNHATQLPTLIADNNSYWGMLYYVYGPGDLPLERINGTTVLYYHHDQLGSTRAMTNSSGAVAATYTYDAYGRQIASTGTVTNSFGYAGEYRDSESGLIYLRARYYDPTTGQFVNRDPIEALTRDAYGYAGNNPLNFTDPSGLYWGEGLVETVVEVGGEIIRHPGDAAKDAGKGAANFGVGFANAALGTDFEGFCGEGQSWSRNIGSATFWVEGALSLGAGAEAAGWRVRFGLHDAHHSFGKLGKLPHLQWNTWRQGVKGSGRAFRIPLPRWFK
jgi:RHS repeat-associated protein